MLQLRILFYFLYLLIYLPLDIALHSIHSIFQLPHSFAEAFCKRGNAFGTKKQEDYKQEDKNLSAAKIQKPQYHTDAGLHKAKLRII